MRSSSRSGFTLIELMVAMTLTLFLMIILSQAFVLSLDIFSGVKGIGDMQQNLRTAAVLIRDDLSHDHLEMSRRLSDPDVVTERPQAGFFAIRQGSDPILVAAATSATPYVNEGTDANSLVAYRAFDHALYFTNRRRGSRPENYMTAALVASTPVELAGVNTFFAKEPYSLFANPYPNPGTGLGYYSSQWAEVIYFLAQTGSTEEPNNPASTIGTPLFGLYRAQFVMPPDGTNLINAVAFDPATNDTFPPFVGMACNKPLTAGFLNFYSPFDAATGARTIAFNAFNVNDVRLYRNSPQGASLVLPNVLSFHVQIKKSLDSDFLDIPQTGLVNTRIFDTAQFNLPAASYNNKFGLHAIQITLRVWDNKTRQTRQITIAQDL